MISSPCLMWGMKFFDLLPLATAWKNFVLASPSLIHLILDLVLFQAERRDLALESFEFLRNLIHVLRPGRHGDHRLRNFTTEQVCNPGP